MLPVLFVNVQLRIFEAWHCFLSFRIPRRLTRRNPLFRFPIAYALRVSSMHRTLSGLLTYCQEVLSVLLRRDNVKVPCPRILKMLEVSTFLNANWFRCFAVESTIQIGALLFHFDVIFRLI
jgi:hypothetical protein